MRQIWALAVLDLRQLLADPGTASFRLVIPIVLIFVIGIANGAFDVEEPAPVIELVNNDDGILAERYVDYVRSNASLVRFCGAGGDPCGDSGDDYETRLRGGATQFAVVIPGGFTEQVRSGDSVTVMLVQETSDPEAASAVSPLLDGAGRMVASLARAGGSAREVSVSTEPGVLDAAASAAEVRAAELLAEQRVRYQQDEIELPARYPLEGFQQSVPGQGTVFVMFSVLAGASFLVVERKRGTLQRTRTAPLGRGRFIAGKILGRFLMGMAQYVVAIGTGAVIGAIFGIEFGTSPLVLLATMAAFTLAASGISILIATLVSREQQASTLSTLIVLTLAPIGGAWWSLDMEFIPQIMRDIAVISPFYWAMEGFRAGIYDLGFAAAALPLFVLLGVALVTGTIAAVRDPS